MVDFETDQAWAVASTLSGTADLVPVSARRMGPVLVLVWEVAMQRTLTECQFSRALAALQLSYFHA